MSLTSVPSADTAPVPEPPSTAPGVHPRGGRGPSFDMFRAGSQPDRAAFPVYANLEDKMCAADRSNPDDAVRHVLAVCAGYAYSDGHTLATMMTRLGMERCRWVAVEQRVDTMFICSTAYVIQSADGRVVIVCYRGTEPVNPLNWLTDLDVATETVPYNLTHQPGNEDYGVHAGFYRNVRATRFAVVDLLSRALNGEPVVAGRDDEGVDLERARAIFLTGHSLGGAMATLLAVMLHAKPDYAELARAYQSTYTYGAPMISTPGLAAACSQKTLADGTTPIADSIFRYVHDRDLVPQLPPRICGAFEHIGHEFRCRHRNGRGEVRYTKEVTGQTLVPTTLWALAVPALGLVSALRGWIPYRASLGDHLPQHYIRSLTPPGVRSEFGD